MAQIVTDDFNRANAATLGANWTVISTDTDLAVASNAGATQSSAHAHADVYTGAGWTGGNDHYAEVAVTANPAADDGGPICRALTSAVTYYTADINNADTTALGSSQTYQLFSVSGGTFTLIASATALVINANDVLRCEAQGTTIRGLVNGVQKVTVVDSSLATGKPGIAWWQGGASVSTFDNFAAGDFSSSTPAVGRISQMFHPGKGTLRQARFYQTPKGSIFATGPNNFTQFLTAAVSFVGADANKTSHFHTASVTFVGSQAKRTAHQLSAALTFTGAIKLATAKLISAVLSFVGAIPVRNITHGLTAALTFTGSQAKQTAHALTATLTFVGGFAKGLFKQLFLTAAVTFTGAVSKQTNKVASAAVTFTGSIPVRAITHGLTAAVTFSGNVTKSTARSFSAALTFVGNSVQGIFKQVFLTAAVNFSGAISRQTGKALPAALTFVGSTTKFINHFLPAAALTFIGAATKQTSRLFTASVAFVGNIVKTIRKPFAAVVNFVGSFSATFIAGGGGTLFTKSFTASVSFTGLTGKTVKKSFTASLGTIGTGIGPSVVLIGQRLAMRLKGIIYQWLD